MTAIAAFTDGRTAALAYDSAMTQGDLVRIDLRKRPGIHDLRSPKGKPRGRMVIATCGTGRLIHEVLNRFEPPSRRRSQDAGDYMVDVAERIQDLLVAPGARADRFVTEPSNLEGEMLAIIDARVFQIGCTLSVTEPACGFIAAGNAREICTGALAALEDQMSPADVVRRAVEIACEHMDGVAGPVQVETTTA